MEQCCKRDTDHDGNCDVHSAPEVTRLQVTYRRGRGNNPASRANLMMKKPQWFVCRRNADNKWIRVSGPHRQKAAVLLANAACQSAKSMDYVASMLAPN